MPADPYFYYRGFTDSTGVITFNINPIISDSVLITVTSQNCIPYEGKCVVRANTDQSIQSQAQFQIEKFKVFPNPARSVVWVRVPFSARRIKIFDVTGKTVKEIAGYGGGELRITLDRLCPGIYFVSSESETEIQIERLIVVK
jgi:hypothetical protein